MPRKTREQYNDYMRVYILNRYHERRAESYSLLGGVCVVCETTEDLQIDHIDPDTKTMDVGTMWSVSRTRYLKELELCQLLCGTHHREKSSREQSVPHGGGVSGKKNCKCDPCRLKKNEYLRDYKRKKRAEAKQGSLVKSGI